MSYADRDGRQLARERAKDVSLTPATRTPLCRSASPWEYIGGRAQRSHCLKAAGHRGRHSWEPVTAGGKVDTDD